MLEGAQDEVYISLHLLSKAKKKEKYKRKDILYHIG